MSNYGWTNEDGEPIMSGEAWRFEQQLDLDSRDDYYADHFYDDDNEPDYCGSCDEPEDECICDEDDEPDGMEDQWLDGYMEDRISTMYEG